MEGLERQAKGLGLYSKADRSICRCCPAGGGRYEEQGQRKEAIVESKCGC